MKATLHDLVSMPEDVSSFFHFSLFYSVRAFVYSSNADLQIVYTPPLYSQVVRPHPLHSKLILASGHNIEANFTNDFCLFLGQDQVTSYTFMAPLNIKVS